MMYTLPKFKSEDAARSQTEQLENLHRWTGGHNGGWWLPLQTVAKTSFPRGLAAPQTAHTATDGNSKPVCRKMHKKAILWPMVFRQLATNARAPHRKKYDEQGLRSVVCCLQIPVTDFKHCGYNAMRLIGCCISCLLPISNSCNSTARACCNVCSCRCLNKYTTSFRHCYNFHALVSIGVEFVGVQPGFLQRLLTQNEHNWDS